ncbi:MULTISPECIES: hypothetical protein [Rhizobium]|uniref:Uncharacterized protein n=1 Tax=Rhizobium miluonense TaxID=411945 RepID=A0A1C3WRN2_9HYPH|nr:hypothetical protein GA0061102_103714 [Rhizobium miluonense]
MPEDIAIVGFDNCELGGSSTSSLTTYKRPRHEMVEAITGMIDGTIEVKQALGMTDEHRLAVEEVLENQEGQYGKLAPEKGFPNFIQLLRQLAEEWKENYPDGYNAQGSTYYICVPGSRSFTM